MNLAEHARRWLALALSLLAAACGAPSTPAPTAAHYERAMPLADTALIAPSTALAPKGNSKNCFGGVPVCEEAGIKVLVNRGYEVGYSETRKDPVWAAYTLRGDVDVHDVSRPKQKFQDDTRVTLRAKDSDYDKSGFDRGHMAPSDAIGQWYGKTAQLGTFIVTNIVPQKSGLNRDVWQGLETLETTFYPSDFEQIWVFAGPIFDANPTTIKNGVQVPNATFKIIVEHDQDPPTVLAVIMNQNQSGQTHKLSEYVTTVRDIEAKAHINFFPELPKAVQDAIETVKADADHWRTSTVLSRNKILKAFGEEED